MNLDNIKAIVNSGKENWERLLLAEISKDPKSIQHVLYMLDTERSESKQLITDLNVFLSKAHLGLKEPTLNKDGFMQKEITEFYRTGRIGHCFANMDDDKQ
jgi:hypothetical protein